MHKIGPVQRIGFPFEIKKGDLLTRRVNHQDVFYIVLKTGWTRSGNAAKIWTYKINKQEYKSYCGKTLITFEKINYETNGNV